MSPLTKKIAASEKRNHDLSYFLDYTSRIGIAIVSTVGILYLFGHIVLWHLNKV